ncbi:MAG: DUF2027 domain-containing protein [Muribaculaceae bacterium]|nr:DUF2027 domain-containing protein [Muribaculaceae bacterium]
MKVGDSVRYLNATGGGTVTRIEGNMAYVEEDGFETPVLMKDLVVVMPAGHQPASGAKLMFDQKAFDAGRGKNVGKEKSSAASSPDEDSISMSPWLARKMRPDMNKIVTETPKFHLYFEPTDIRNLDRSRFAIVIVNDSSYVLSFCLSARSDNDKGWRRVIYGFIHPEEMMDCGMISHEDLPEYENIQIQGFWLHETCGFEGQRPVDIRKRLDITKFHKFHCFRENEDFDTPVLEVALDTRREAPDAEQLRKLEESFRGNVAKAAGRSKNGVDSRHKKERPNPADNPHKLLPPIEVDLHINELTDTTAGMEPKDMLMLQLEFVRRTMELNKKRKGQKIIFIHGKGEGVLRKEVLNLLKREYPTADLQDASFREYGFGATLVTV